MMIQFLLLMTREKDVFEKEQWHMVENIGEDNLCIVEIQYGSECEEEDIEKILNMKTNKGTKDIENKENNYKKFLSNNNYKIYGTTINYLINQKILDLDYNLVPYLSSHNQLFVIALCTKN